MQPCMHTTHVRRCRIYCHAPCMQALKYFQWKSKFKHTCSNSIYLYFHVWCERLQLCSARVFVDAQCTCVRRCAVRVCSSMSESSTTARTYNLQFKFPCIYIGVQCIYIYIAISCMVVDVVFEFPCAGPIMSKSWTLRKFALFVAVVGLFVYNRCLQSYIYASTMIRSWICSYTVRMCS